MAKFSALGLLAFICVAFSAMPQTSDQTVGIEKEPHHTLILENPQRRVFRLVLQPNESTVLHRHAHPYAFPSVKDGEISNEIPGRTPVIRDLSAGEPHTSKGGFSVAERNTSSTEADLIVVERIADPGPAFDVPMVNFQYHDTAIAELFEGASMRAYTVRMAGGGRTEPHEQRFHRLLIALTDVHLLDQVDEQKQAPISMKPGEVRWIPKGSDRAVANIGSEPCSFITIEFN